MSDSPKKTQATLAIELALERYEIGRATTGEPFAVPRDGPRVAHPFRGGSRSLRHELAAAFYERHGKTASAGALADALAVLEGRAQDADPVELHLRSAVVDGQVVVDLGTPDGRVVVIEPGRWGVQPASPVLFRRTRVTRALPAPASDGQDLDALREHINVTDSSWPLVVAWLVGALLADRPCPGMFLLGEQGTAKSTTGRRVVAITDPSAAALRAEPDNVSEWAVAANSSRVIGLDNLSYVPPWLSDTLCRGVTGDGFVRRQLYSDSDLVVLEIRRAFVITAIDVGALRGDLADRFLPIELERIRDDRRRDEADIDAAFDAAWPALTAALYDTVAQVLELLPTIELPRRPRMADFGKILAAVDQILGTDGLASYLDAGRSLLADVVDTDPLGAAIQRHLQTRPSWRGTAAELLDAIRPDGALPKGWPTDATRLSGKLKRLAPALRAAGIETDTGKTRGARWISLWRGDAEPPAGDAELPLDTASVPPPDQQNRPQGDARDAADAKSPLCFNEGEKGGKKGNRATASTAPPASRTPHTWDADTLANDLYDETDNDHATAI